MSRSDQEQRLTSYRSKRSEVTAAIQAEKLSDDPNDAHDDVHRNNPPQPHCPHADVHVDPATRDLIAESNKVLAKAEAAIARAKESRANNAALSQGPNIYSHRNAEYYRARQAAIKAGAAAEEKTHTCGMSKL